MGMTLADAQEIDLGPALDAFSNHIPVLLESAEKFRSRRTTFSAQEDFMWKDGELAGIITVYVIALSTPCVGGYQLQLGFGGKEASAFVKLYRERLIGIVKNVLKTAGWEMPEEGVFEKPTDPGYIFFSMRRGSKPA